MSAGGHISDMMNRIKQNALLKNARRRKFKGGNDYSKTKSIKTEYNLTELSKPELEAFKKRVQKIAQQEKRKRTVFLIVCSLILLIILLIFNNLKF